MFLQVGIVGGLSVLDVFSSDCAYPPLRQGLICPFQTSFPSQLNQRPLKENISKTHRKMATSLPFPLPLSYQQKSSTKSSTTSFPSHPPHPPLSSLRSSRTRRHYLSPSLPNYHPEQNPSVYFYLSPHPVPVPVAWHIGGWR